MTAKTQPTDTTIDKTDDITPQILLLFKKMHGVVQIQPKIPTDRSKSCVVLLMVHYVIVIFSAAMFGLGPREMSNVDENRCNIPIVYRTTINLDLFVIAISFENI